MSEEIKEVLNFIENKIEPKNSLLFEKWNILKNYITNLQQENKQLKEDKRKAIEYINENTYLGDGKYTNHCDMLSRNELLEILGDKENE